MMASVQLQGIIEDPRGRLLSLKSLVRDRRRGLARKDRVPYSPFCMALQQRGTVHTAEAKLLAPIDIVIPQSPLPSGLVSRLGVQVDGRRATSGFRMKDRRLGIFRLGV